MLGNSRFKDLWVMEISFLPENSFEEFAFERPSLFKFIEISVGPTMLEQVGGAY